MCDFDLRGQAQELRAAGKEPYAYSYARTHMAAQLQEQFRDLGDGESADVQARSDTTLPFSRMQGSRLCSAYRAAAMQACPGCCDGLVVDIRTFILHARAWQSRDTAGNELGLPESCLVLKAESAAGDNCHWEICSTAARSCASLTAAYWHKHGFPVLQANWEAACPLHG